jgi:hypothetical protein
MPLNIPQRAESEGEPSRAVREAAARIIVSINKKDGIPVPPYVQALADAELPTPAPFSERSKRVPWELARAIAFHLLQREHEVRRYGLSHPRPFSRRGDEWKRLLSDAPLGEILAALFDETEYGYEMRRSAPFAGYLRRSERLFAIETAKRPPQ